MGKSCDVLEGGLSHRLVCARNYRPVNLASYLSLIVDAHGVGATLCYIYWSHTCSRPKSRSLGHGPLSQETSMPFMSCLLGAHVCDHLDTMLGVLVKVRPGHQRRDLLTTESFTATCCRLAYEARQRLCRRKVSTEYYDGTGLERCTVN